MVRPPLLPGLSALLAAAILCAAPSALADEADATGDHAAADDVAPDEKPLHAPVRLTYANLFAVRLNPSGLSNKIDLGLKLRLYDSSHAVLRDAYVGLRVTPMISPAFSSVAAAVEVKPLSVLLLSAAYRFKGWHGISDGLMPFASPNANHTADEMERREELDENFATVGREVDLRAQLLAKVGPVAMRSDLHALHFESALEGRGSLFYHFVLDTLVPDGGWAVTNDTDLVFLTDFGLVAGARSHVTHVPYDDALYAPGTSTENPNTPIYRVGPLLAYVFYDDPEATINKPTLIGIFNWYLAHRYRTGADVSQAVPYVALAFRIEGNMWTSE